MKPWTTPTLEEIAMNEEVAGIKKIANWRNNTLPTSEREKIKDALIATYGEQLGDLVMDKKRSGDFRQLVDWASSVDPRHTTGNGTFYFAASPDAKPFVAIGGRVNPDSVVCIIEAMKVFNEIKAETSGVIAKVLVSNGQAVEFGQPLFMVKPA